MANDKKSIFEVLSAIDCSEHIETKKQGNGLSYLSWAWAWHICKEHYPNAEYTIYETAEGRPYFDDGRTAWVKTGVKIDGLEHIEYLPILDQMAHASLPLERITSWDMNKAIQRSLTKALARHGLGLYIYAGEDLPWTGIEENAAAREVAKPAPQKKTTKKAAQAPQDQPEVAPASDVILNMEKAVYMKWVAGIAEGKTSNGQSWRDGFIQKCRPNQFQLEQLDKDVFAYKLQNNIQ